MAMPIARMQWKIVEKLLRGIHQEEVKDILPVNCSFCFRLHKSSQKR